MYIKRMFLSLDDFNKLKAIYSRNTLFASVRSNLKVPHSSML